MNGSWSPLAPAGVLAQVSWAVGSWIAHCHGTGQRHKSGWASDSWTPLSGRPWTPARATLGRDRVPLARAPAPTGASAARRPGRRWRGQEALTEPPLLLRLI